AALRWRLEDQDADVRKTAYLVSLYTRPALVETLRPRDPELKRQLTELETVGQTSVAQGAAAPNAAREREVERKLDLPLAELGLADEIIEALEAEGLTTVRELAVRTKGEVFDILLADEVVEEVE